MTLKLFARPLLRLQKDWQFSALHPLIWPMTTPREQLPLPSQPVKLFHHSSLAGYSVVVEVSHETVVELLRSAISMSQVNSLPKQPVVFLSEKLVVPIKSFLFMKTITIWSMTARAAATSARPSHWFLRAWCRVLPGRAVVVLV